MSCCRLCPHCVLCCAQPCLILYNFIAQQTLLSWNSPSKNTGAGYHFLLQRTFLTQGSNLHLLCLLHFRWILYPLSHWGSPRCSCIKPATTDLLWSVLPLRQAECYCCFQFPNQLWKFCIYYSNSIEENCRAYRRQICFCLLRIPFFFPLVIVPWLSLGHTPFYLYGLTGLHFKPFLA